MLVPAGALVNGVSIYRVTGREVVEYLHLELDRHDVVFAEGAAAETFLDDGSRGMFHNAAEFRALYPERETRPARYCAARVEDGEEVERLRSRFARAALGVAIAG
jgi:hypothetical protein